MPPTLAEFSARVGMTPCTVSRALNSDPRVRAKTRQRIVSLAREMGYRPNFAARSLSKNIRRNVGVVIATPQKDPVYLYVRKYAPFLVELTERVEAQGIGLMLGLTAETISPSEDSVLLPCVADQLHADRIVVLGYMWPRLAEEIDRLSLPAVVVDGPSCGLPTVHRDEEYAAEQLIDHLVEQGHRRIAFLNHAPQKVLSGYQDALWPKGYLKAMTRHRLVPMPGWELFEEHTAAIDRLLALDEPPTAMILFDDEIALWAIDYLKTLGLSVPKDISIAAMLDLGISGHTPQPVSRMTQPQCEMAREAMDLLLNNKDSGHSDHAQPVIELPGSFVAGVTVAPPNANFQ